MSMPSINLHCSHCDFRSCTTLLWGRFKYVYEQGECNLNREMAWCFQCEKLVPCESFDDSEEIQEEINKAVDSIQKSALRPVSLTLTKSSKKYKRYELEKLRSLSKKLQINAERRGTEKCLNCGSTHVKFFDGDYQLDYESGNFTGAKRTGFKHPGCDGELIASPNPFRIHMRFIPKLYTVGGDKIPSDEEE